MQVICTDGTTFTCEGYELTEYGVVIYGQELDPDDERYAGDPEQTGYVPHDRLWYILPDSVEPMLPGLANAQGRPGQRASPRNQQSVPGQSQNTTNQSQQATGQQGQPPGQRQPGTR